MPAAGFVSIHAASRTKSISARALLSKDVSNDFPTFGVLHRNKIHKTFDSVSSDFFPIFVRAHGSTSTTEPTYLLGALFIFSIRRRRLQNICARSTSYEMCRNETRVDIVTFPGIYMHTCPSLRQLLTRPITVCIVCARRVHATIAQKSTAASS